MTYTYTLLTDNVASSRRAKLFADVASKVHDAVIVQAMQGIGRSVTIAELAAAIDTARYITKDPLAKSVRWHLNKLEKEAIVKCTAADSQPVEVPVASPDPAPAVTDAPSPNRKARRAAKKAAVEPQVDVGAINDQRFGGTLDETGDM